MLLTKIFGLVSTEDWSNFHIWLILFQLHHRVIQQLIHQSTMFNLITQLFTRTISITTTDTDQCVDDSQCNDATQITVFFSRHHKFTSNRRPYFYSAKYQQQQQQQHPSGTQNADGAQHNKQLASDMCTRTMINVRLRDAHKPIEIAAIDQITWPASIRIQRQSYKTQYNLPPPSASHIPPARCLFTRRLPQGYREYLCFSDI